MKRAQLFDAARNGEAADVDELIQSGANTETRSGVRVSASVDLLLFTVRVCVRT